MNETVYVEFLCEGHESYILIRKLRELDFEQFIVDNDGLRGNDIDWYGVSGRINAQYASLIKLQDSWLAERMRISYIPDELKNKYRNTDK